MQKEIRIIRSEGGTKRCTLALSDIHIADLWHVAQRQKHEEDKEEILDTWGLCHDLLAALRAINNGVALDEPVATAPYRGANRPTFINTGDTLEASHV